MAVGALTIASSALNFLGNTIGGGLGLAASKRNKEATIAAGQFNLQGLEIQAGMLQQENEAKLQRLKIGVIYLTIAIVVILIFYGLYRWIAK